MLQDSSKSNSNFYRLTTTRRFRPQTQPPTARICIIFASVCAYVYWTLCVWEKWTGMLGVMAGVLFACNSCCISACMSAAFYARAPSESNRRDVKSTCSHKDNEWCIQTNDCLRINSLESDERKNHRKKMKKEADAVSFFFFFLKKLLILLEWITSIKMFELKLESMELI